MDDDKPSRAGIYCRMSLAVMNDLTKVEDQARIGRDLAGQLGWAIARDCGHPHTGGVYTDNSRSAWKKNRKRPAWDAMLADVLAGRLDAIVVYHGDRLIRQPRDLEDLIDLAEGKGIRLAAPIGLRDLDNSDDRFVLRILVAQACMESDNTSRRRKAQYARWRREGRVRTGGRGGRAFGFATDGMSILPADRCDVITRQEVSEADAIREMGRRVLDGEGTAAIARDMTARGWRTPAGGEFTHGTVRKMLARPRYAGLMPDGEHPAAWEPVWDPDRATAAQEWQSLMAVLDGRAAGYSFATNARRYLLSGIAVCGVCGSGLQIRMESGRAHLAGYGCVKPGCRKVQRSVALLDAYVITRVLAVLASPDNPPGRVPRRSAAEFQMLAIQLAETEAAIADPAQGPQLGLLLQRLESIRARIAQLRELAAGEASARLLAAHAGITTRARFGALPLGTRRALVSACYTITVLPASGRGPGFRTEDVKLARR